MKPQTLITTLAIASKFRRGDSRESLIMIANANARSLQLCERTAAAYSVNVPQIVKVKVN